MIYLLAASLAYGLFVTILYMLVQARVDEVRRGGRDRAARRAKQPPIPAQREGAGR